MNTDHFPVEGPSLFFFLTLSHEHPPPVFSPLCTFKYGADVFPDRDAATVVELTQGQLHVEERDPAKHCHQEVGQQEGTWGDPGGRDEEKNVSRTLNASRHQNY